MAHKKDKMEYGEMEGHGEPSNAPPLRKGKFHQVGTVVPLSKQATSPNQKSGSSSGGEQ